jgi:hypothetical protein
VATRINRSSDVSSIISLSQVKVPLEIDGEQVGWLVLGTVTTASNPTRPMTQHQFGIECLCGEKPSMTIVDVELDMLSKTERNMRTHLEKCPAHNLTQR